ncbi:MAG: ATP synthase subunit C [Ruminococcus sp.]|jgi:V/A-type H+-transporting ATPase subunit K|nr:ATP synthase subunit C [Ruminococcus sp.]
MMYLIGLFVIPIIITALLITPVIMRFRRYGTGKKARNALIGNLCTFFGVMVLCVVIPLGFKTYAAEAPADSGTAQTETAESSAASAAGLAYIGAALAVGLGSIGCGIAVGGAAPAAIGAVSEDPKAFSKALIFVALGEGVAIYGLLIAFLLINSVG